MKYHSLIVPTAEWIKVFPSFMHPVVGRFASLPLKYYFAQFTTCAQPLVRQRIADMEHAQEDPTSKHGSPDDLLTFLIKGARTCGYLREDAERKICGELIGAGFAAIYTTAITASSALLNLVTSPPKRAYMELIWSEVNEIAEKNKDPWTKSSLARMYRVDSALRESMRLSTFEAIVLTRLVRQDITLDNTFRLSRGTRIAIPGYCIHRDESLYPKADEYDAFRFLHREGGNLEAPLFDLEDDVKGNVRPKKQSLVTTSETFLVFGHGRQACPGRYLASDTLKLIIAYITLNYELRPTGPRPSNVWFRSMILPPVSARIAVKRRSRPAKLP
jgi:cytochrome P450